MAMADNKGAMLFIVEVMAEADAEASETSLDSMRSTWDSLSLSTLAMLTLNGHARELLLNEFELEVAVEVEVPNVGASSRPCGN